MKKVLKYKLYAISIPKFYKKYIEYFMLSTYLNVGVLIILYDLDVKIIWIEEYIFIKILYNKIHKLQFRNINIRRRAI